jgi:hypothetical protein
MLSSGFAGEADASLSSCSAEQLPVSPRSPAPQYHLSSLVSSLDMPTLDCYHASVRPSLPVLIPSVATGHARRAQRDELTLISSFPLVSQNGSWVHKTGKECDPAYLPKVNIIVAAVLLGASFSLCR